MNRASVRIWGFCFLASISSRVLANDVFWTGKAASSPYDRWVWNDNWWDPTTQTMHRPTSNDMVYVGDWAGDGNRCTSCDEVWHYGADDTQTIDGLSVFGSRTVGQSGEITSNGTVLIGDNSRYTSSSSNGSYELTGGSLKVDSSPTVVGYTGFGQFQNTGGHHTISGDDLLIGTATNAQGIYVLKGSGTSNWGDLSARSIVITGTSSRLTVETWGLAAATTMTVGEGRATVTGGNATVIVSTVRVGSGSGAHGDLTVTGNYLQSGTRYRSKIVEPTGATSSLIVGYNNGTGDVVVKDGGQISLDTITINANSTLSGGGAAAIGTAIGSSWWDITGGVTNSGGTVNPGTSSTTLTLTIDGSYTQSGGALHMDITAAGSHDKLAITDEATLGGTLQVSLTGSLLPLNFDKDYAFDILECSSRTDTFDDVDLPANGVNGIYWSTLRLYTQGIIDAGSILGDVDRNGFANALDIHGFITCSTTPPYHLEADCNQDGAVNALDISGFVRIITGGGSAGQVIPEPGSALLAVAGVAVVALRRRGRG